MKREWSRLLEQVLGNFSSKSDERRLTEALREGPSTVIADIWYKGCSVACERDRQTLRSRWRPLRETLFRLAEGSPAIGVPLILAFASSVKNRLVPAIDEDGQHDVAMEHEITFDVTRAAELFELPRIAALIDGTSPPPSLAPQDQQLWRAAQSALAGTS